MKKNLCLLRHSSIPQEFFAKYIGRMDVPLSEVGINQSKTVSQSLPNRFKTGKIFLSPSKRALDCFAHMQFPKNCEVETRAEFSELDFGEWEGKLFSEIYESNPNQLSEWAEFSPEFRFPNGESLKEFQKRCEAAINLIRISEYKNILIISHGGFLSLLLALLLGLPASDYLKFRISPAGYALLELFQDGHSTLTDLVKISQNRRQEWPG